jgi:hypothetical protein
MPPICAGERRADRRRRMQSNEHRECQVGPLHSSLARSHLKYSWDLLGRVAGLEADLGLVGYQCRS